MLKFTIHMSMPQKSWSEAHYGNFTGGPSAQGGIAALMSAARAQALGYLATLDRIVVSSYPANRRTRAYEFATVTQPTNVGQPNQSANLVEMANNAPLVQWQGLLIDPLVGSAPPANYYPAGCWDTLFNEDGPDAGQLNKGTGGYTRLVAWLEFLTTNQAAPAAESLWCYRTRNPQGAIQADDLVPAQVLNGPIGIETAAQLVDPTAGNRPLVAGDKVWLSGWRVGNPRRQNLEGSYRIARVVALVGPPATWTYYLYGTNGYNIFNWPFMGQIGPLLFGFASYNDYTVERWVTRKRGARYDLSLGRSPIRRTV